MAIALFLLLLAFFPISRFLGYHATYFIFRIPINKEKSILKVSVLSTLLVPLLAIGIGTVLEILGGMISKIIGTDIPIWAFIGVGTALLSFIVFLILNKKENRSVRKFASELVVDATSIASFAWMFALQMELYPEFWRWN